MIFNVHITGSINTTISASDSAEAERLINERLENVYPQWECCVDIAERRQDHD